MREHALVACLVALAVLAVLVVAALAVLLLALRRRRHDRHAGLPVVAVQAVVLEKRAHRTIDLRDPVRESYWVTFLLPDGRRRELRVEEATYVRLSESDEGELTFQGSRFRGFGDRRR